MITWLWRTVSGLFTHPLVRQSRGPAPAERARAAQGLGAVREAWATAELLRLLIDLNAPVRAAAREGLKAQDASALAALIQGLQHAHPDIGTAAAELLGELRDPSAVGPLLRALKYGERPVQLAARRALERFGAVAVPELRAALSEPQPWVREQIAGALAVAEGGG